MKKNRLMRLACLLIVLTLMTSCFVGGTFAKYTTSAGAEDTARVAKWGFDEATSLTFELFNVSDDTGIGADGLIAPGSSKTINFDFVNSATDAAPEVAYKVTVSTDGSTANIGDLDGVVTWKLGTNSYTSWSAFLAAIKNLSGNASGSKEYAPNDPLPDVLKNGVNNSVGWEWPFNGDDDKDTKLGNTYTQDVTLKITITVEQLNTYPSTP